MLLQRSLALLAFFTLAAIRVSPAGALALQGEACFCRGRSAFLPCDCLCPFAHFALTRIFCGDRDESDAFVIPTT
jgi:hypothetical protein